MTHPTNEEMTPLSKHELLLPLGCPVCALVVTLGVMIHEPPHNCWNCGKVWFTEDGKVVKVGP